MFMPLGWTPFSTWLVNFSLKWLKKIGKKLPSQKTNGKIELLRQSPSQFKSLLYLVTMEIITKPSN